jgi:hypothetical protein
MFSTGNSGQAWGKIQGIGVAMSILDTAKFTAQTFHLKMEASKSPEQIDRLGHKRLQQLVDHARNHSQFWHEKLSGTGNGSFALSDLPTTNKTELMEHFDEAVTVDDVRRDELADFMENLSNVGKYFRGKYAVSRTSGSQGQPLLLIQTREIIDLLFALHLSRGNNQPIGLRAAVEHIWRPARLAVVILKPGFTRRRVRSATCRKAPSATWKSNCSAGTTKT